MVWRPGSQQAVPHCLSPPEDGPALTLSGKSNNEGLRSNGPKNHYYIQTKKGTTMCYAY